MRKLLYFVGAGLTKSLQLPNKPLPLMYDYISVMANYVTDDVILTTLAALECEENYPYKWEDTESKELAKRLNGPNADRSLENRSAFCRALKNKPYESIEDLLGTSSTAVIRFIYAIDRLFYLVGWDITWGPLERFLKNQLELNETHHTFVSFNYDLFLDRAVQKQTAGKWDVFSGYGFQISWQINEDPAPANGHGPLPVEQAIDLQPSADSSSSRFQILKPHGSLNWLVPHKIPYKYTPAGLALEDHKVIIPLTANRELRYWFKSGNFHHVSCGNELPSDVTPCIIAPVSAKKSDLSFIKKTHLKVSQAIKDADEVYILGWSMPKT